MKFRCCRWRRFRARCGLRRRSPCRLRPLSTSQYAAQPKPPVGHTAALVLMLAAACVLPPLFCGMSGFAPLIGAAGYGLAVWYAFRQLDGMSGDISGFGLTLGELAGAAVLCLVR